MGHTPSTAGTFQKKFRKNSGKTLETLSERFLEFPSRVRLGCPKPYNSRHLRLPEHFQNSLPPSTARDASFFQKWFRRGPLRTGHGIPSSTGGISDDVSGVGNCFPWGSPREGLPPPSFLPPSPPLPFSGSVQTSNSGCQRERSIIFRDHLSVSLGGTRTSLKLLKTPGLPNPQTSPEVLGDFPGTSLKVDFKTNPEVARKFHNLKLPQKLP